MPSRVAKKDIETQLKINRLEAELKQKDADLAYVMMCTGIEIPDSDKEINHEEIDI